MFKQLRAALVSFLVFTFITGIIYPLAVTGFAQAMYPHQARGSLIKLNEKIVGSELITQGFTDPKYFWPRPSAANYNGAGASGSNFAQSNPALVDAAKQRIEALLAADPTNTAAIPVELVTASASGLDPHISPAAAAYQLPRVARARGLTVEALRQIVNRHTEKPAFSILSEARINVLRLNLELDHPELAGPDGGHNLSHLYRGMGFEP